MESACIDMSTLAAWCSGRLESTRRSAVDHHVDTCDSCRALMAAAGRVCASASEGSIQVEPADLLGVDLLAFSELLQTPVGRYRILNVVGGGGLGLVLAAWDERLQRRVAIKALRGTSDRERAGPAIRREAMALAALSHPRIVQVFDVIEHHGQFFLVMELVTGTTLRTWQASHSLRDVVRAYVAVAHGLAAVHSAGLVHCDVKPDNVLVADDGRILLADFGFAITTDPARQRRDQVGGTPRYMAPEQRQGAPLSPACDQYGLSISLWEALGRGLPPQGRSRIPRRVRRALERGLSEAPGDRWPSIDGFAKALEPSARGLTVGLAGAAVLGVAGLAYGATGDDAAVPVSVDASPTAELAATDVDAAAAVDAALDRSAELRGQGELMAAHQVLDEVPTDGLDGGARTRLEIGRIQALGRLDRSSDALRALAALEVNAQRMPDEVRAQLSLEIARFGTEGMESSVRRQWLDAARTSLRRTGVDPDAHVHVRDVEGAVARVEGRHEDAREHYEAAAGLLDATHRPALHVEVLSSYGGSLERLGRQTEAEAVFERAQAIVTREGLQASDLAVELLISVANGRAHSGDRDAAIPMLERAIERADAIEGLHPAIAGGALSDLGAYYLEENRRVDAFDALTRAEALLPNFYGVQANLAIHWSKIPCQGQPDKARCTRDALARAHAHEMRAYEQARTQLGEDHPTVAQIGANLVYDYLQRGEIEQANKYAAPALAGLRRAYGDDHAKLVRPLLSTIELRVRLGDRPAAVKAVRQLDRAASANAAALGPLAMHVIHYVLGRTRIWAGQPKEDDPERVAAALAGLGERPPDDVRLIDAWFEGTFILQ